MTQHTDTDGGRRSLRGLWGGLVFITLVAAYWWTPWPVYGQVGGGGSGTTTFTTSTTRHTTITNACPGGLNHTETSVTTSTSLGPGTIMIGEDQSQSFFVAAGTTNLNINTHTETFLDVCDAAAIPTLSEWAQIGMAALLVGGGLLALCKRSA